MTTMMPDIDGESNDERTELADRHDGVAVDREHVQATIEYEVDLSEYDLDELPDAMGGRDFARNLATSRAEKELDPTFGIHSNDAVAQPVDRHREPDTYTVLVRIEQND